MVSLFLMITLQHVVSIYVMLLLAKMVGHRNIKINCILITIVITLMYNGPSVNACWTLCPANRCTGVLNIVYMVTSQGVKFIYGHISKLSFRYGVTFFMVFYL